MKESEAVKAINKKFVDRWVHLFGLYDWEIKFRYNKLDENTYGCCSSEPAHKSALILLDIEKHKTQKELQQTCIHELAHLIHSHFDTHRDTVNKLLSANASEVADEIWSLGAESVVSAIENLLKKLGVDTKGNI